MKKLICLFLLFGWGSAQAEIDVIDFDNLTPEQLGPLFCCDFYKLGYSLDVDGYNFHNIGYSGGGSAYGIAVWETNHSANADPGGFTYKHSYAQSVTTMTKIDGGAFDVVSMDVANYNNSSAAAVPVSIWADLEGGGTVSTTITTDLFLGLETIDVNWTGITAFYFRNDSSQPIQVDNIAFNPLPDPDPGPDPIPLTSQVTMDFDSFSITSCNPCEVYGFSFLNGFYGGITPDPFTAPPGSDGEALVGIGNTSSGRHFLMTPLNGLEFGIESLDVYFWDDSQGMFSTDTWILRGYDTNENPLAEVTIQRPSNEGQWVSVALDPIWHSGVSKIEFFGQEEAYGLFAFMDNLVVNVPPTQIKFDMQPWYSDNEIDPASQGAMPVGIITTNTADGDLVDFDALQVDAATVRFGAGEASIVGVTAPVDLDGDTVDDLLLGFAIQDAGILCEDTELTVTGKTYAGDDFMGVDSINTINCGTSSCHP